MKCQNCKYWDQLEDNRDSGFCCRHAPKPTSLTFNESGPKKYASWPVTYADAWCGEFEAPIPTPKKQWKGKIY